MEKETTNFRVFKGAAMTNETYTRDLNDGWETIIDYQQQGYEYRYQKRKLKPIEENPMPELKVGDAILFQWRDAESSLISVTEVYDGGWKAIAKMGEYFEEADFSFRLCSDAILKIIRGRKLFWEAKK